MQNIAKQNVIGPSILHVAHIEGFDNRSVLLTIVRLDDIVLSPQHGGIFLNIYKKTLETLNSPLVSRFNREVGYHRIPIAP